MQKKVFTIVFFIFFIAICYSQQIQRSTLGLQGNSQIISTNENSFIVQQSIGQESIIGTFKKSGIILRQGFIQPPTISSEIIAEETNIEATIYPNPFESSINIIFNDIMKEGLHIYIYDMLGRVVYKNNRGASQRINISLNNLASAMYSIHISSGAKQFKANIIKR